MRHEKIGTGACDTGPNENCVSNSAAYSTNAPKSQPRTIPPMPCPEGGSVAGWKESLVDAGLFRRVEVVDGELGPIALLGSPFVCVGFRDDCTLVWICPSRLPHNWSDPFRVFLHRPGKVSSEAIRYAKALAERVRGAALKEEERRGRHKAAVLREKFGGGE